MIEEIIKLREDGLSFRKIASQLNTTLGKVQYRWNKYSSSQEIQRIVRHRQTGMLMVPGDAESLLNNIDLLFQNPQSAKEIGNKGKQIVKSLYGWKRIASQTVKVIEDMLINKRVNVND